MAVVRRRPLVSNDNTIVLAPDAGKQHWLVESSPAARPSESTPLLRPASTSSTQVARAQSSVWLQDLLVALQRGFELIFTFTGCTETRSAAPVIPLDDITRCALGG